MGAWKSATARILLSVVQRPGMLSAVSLSLYCVLPPMILLKRSLLLLLLLGDCRRRDEIMMIWCRYDC